MRVTMSVSPGRIVGLLEIGHENEGAVVGELEGATCNLVRSPLMIAQSSDHLRPRFSIAMAWIALLRVRSNSSTGEFAA